MAALWASALVTCVLPQSQAQTDAPRTTGAGLNIVADITPPQLIAAANSNTVSILVTFSEPVAPQTATVLANYALQPAVDIVSAVTGTNGRTVLLTTRALTMGTQYALTVNNVTDTATPANTIAANSQVTFTASELFGQILGTTQGTADRISSTAFNVRAGGQGITGTTDTAFLASQQRSGNFDIQVRIEAADVTDPFLQAGIMARGSTTDTHSPFAAVFAASAQVGCYFQSRSGTSADAPRQYPRGDFPVNFPQAWLRLQRVGNIFTGFASLDGQTWYTLGTATIALPSTTAVGLAASANSADTNVATAVRFRDYGTTVSRASASYVSTTEPLWPSSRRTGIVFSEIMYHPKQAPGQTNDLAFVEIYNAGAILEDLGNWRLSGDIDFTFPAGLKLGAGQFLVIAADPASLQAATGRNGFLGPYAGSLAHKGGTLRLRDNNNAIKLEVGFSNTSPWPAAAAGAGHSLVLGRPSYGESSPKAWSASTSIGGSPGDVDTKRPSPLLAVVINEFLAHTDPPQVDYLELYNHSNVEVDLSGCYLSDTVETNKYRIPDGTRIKANGFLAFDETQLGFRLDATGESLFFVDPTATRVLDAITFDAQENGVASGRCPDGGPAVRRLAVPTPGKPNATWRQEDIVINELMYDPISLNDDDQFVEILNRSQSTVDLSHWSFVAGIDFKFPTGASLSPGGYAVVAKDKTRLLSRYPGIAEGNLYGNFKGTLKHGGERVALAMPDTIVSTNALGDLVTNHIDIVVSEVTYEDGGRWGHWAAGGGPSLELIDPDADPLQAANWADSNESSKTQWELVEATGRLELGDTAAAPNRIHISMLGEGECMVDELEVIKAGSTNLLRNGGFETSGWSFFGNHSLSTIESAGAYAGTSALHVRGQGDGDTGINTIRAVLNTGLASGNTVTIRARVRWLVGWPEVLFRLRGSHFELPARLTVPTNLGTPGAQNSRRVAKSGPAIYAVSHAPALPPANTPVVVTCRISDPAAVSSLLLKYRVDPVQTYSSVTMRDDGAGGDALANDGIYSATIPANGSGVIIAFRIEATDTQAGTSVFPSPNAIWPYAKPSPECMVRWDEPVPNGSFPHYHMWNAQAVNNPIGNALNNTYRDCTVVYGNSRIIYNAGFRDKGSPFHGGYGDTSLRVPTDDLLLGVTERVLAATGNGGEEDTQLRGQVADWICRSLGLPFLHRHYVQGYRNGGQLHTILEDMEDPNGYYANSWFPDGQDGDLYKIAVWFEFSDDNATFSSTSATLQSFKSTGASYRLGRYRWNFQRRPNDGTANNYTNLYDLVAAANNTTASYVDGFLAQADVEEWMRIFGYHRVTGNWDSWSFNVGQNMFLYKQTGGRWVLMPWDIDFVLGLGNGTSDPLWNGQDPVVNRMYSTAAFKRMIWRLYQDAVTGPMLATNYSPQIAARRNVLIQNGITSLGATNSIYTYMEGRRKYIAGQIAAGDPKQFAITTSGGTDFTNTTPSVILAGTAPFAVATILVNGGVYPTSWTDTSRFAITIPLTQATNVLNLLGLDRLGNPLTNAVAGITVYYSGAIPQPRGLVVLNEIHYNPLEPGASFIELFNSSSTIPFDLSGWRLDGVGYAFPAGATIAPNSYVVLAGNKAALNAAYGGSVNVFGEFPGSLNNGGETLRLVAPDASGTNETVVSDVRYDQLLPWPPNADGFGPSLQLVDASQDAWRVANWAATATNDTARVTPGKANSTRQTLATFPAVWLNEIFPNNTTGPVDNFGEHDPSIEIYNAGTNAVDLSNLYLTDTFTNLLKWQFPQGTVLATNAFLLVWADGQPAQSTPGAPHTNFRLDPLNGTVALAWQQGSPASPAALDFIDYKSLPSGRSIGSYPDGEPRKRRSFYYPTPGQPNNPTFPAIGIRINEFMADNVSTILNPSDLKFDDWFELYNAGSSTVDLTGYTLTDSLANPNTYTIPSGYVVQPGGFLLVWADGSPKYNSPTNADLHVNFKLAKSGTDIGLFSPDGTLVDGLRAGMQTTDVSMGLFPDGTDSPVSRLTVPTPRSPNILAGANHPPVVQTIPEQTVTEGTRLQFTAVATDSDEGQHLTFSLGADAPAGVDIDTANGVVSWTPTEEQGPGVYDFAIRATDDGLPSRVGGTRVHVTVLETNRAPALDPVPEQTVEERATLLLQIVATDPDRPANTLTFSLDTGAPSGMSIDPVTGLITWTPAENQGGKSFIVTARVTDNGTPALSSVVTFNASAIEIDDPPYFTQNQPQTVDEGTTLDFFVQAIDPDGPNIPVVYSLEGKVPPGLTLNPETGEVRWTPTESQGPGTYAILVRATSDTGTPRSSAETFGITVNEVNQAPVLLPLGDVPTVGGQTVHLTAQAADADLPAQQLVFALDPSAPEGATIHPITGEFRWPVPEDAPAGTNNLTVIVTDNGSPSPLSSRQMFSVIVTPRFQVAINEILYKPATNRSEFIELANASKVTPWDISGCTLRGSNLTYTFPSGTILAPGAFRCVVRDQAAFHATYGSAPTIAGTWTGTLGINGDDLTLAGPGSPNAGTVLNRVRYLARAPWPSTEVITPGTSLQLIDALRDNSRVANWAVTSASAANLPWQRVVATGTASSSTVYYYLETVGSVYLDDVRLVAGSDPDAGENLLPNGDFESAFPGLFTVSPNLSQSAPSTTVKHSGNSSLKMVTTTGGTTRASAIYIDLSTPLVQGAPYTLSYWYLPNTNGGTLTLRLSGNGIRSTVDLTPNPALLVGSTPGAPNTTAAALPEFPAVYISEVVPSNAGGLLDSSGTHQPWIELVNTGSAPVSLAQWSLSNTYSNPGAWAFPAGTVLAPGEYLVIFADGRPALSHPSELHTSFRLDPASGSVLLSALQSAGKPAILDYLDYVVPSGDQSFGHVPGDESGAGSMLAVPTPWRPNPAPTSNRAPVIRPPDSNLTAFTGTTVAFPISATDPDPAQTLAFSFGFAAPEGTQLNPATGAFSWNIGLTQAGVYNYSILVADDGVPPLTAETQFRVVVLPAETALSAFIEQKGTLTLEWNSAAQVAYRLEYVDTLGTPWNLLAEVIASDRITRVAIPLGPSRSGYYRVVVP